MSQSDEMRDLFVRWKASGKSLVAFGKAEGITYAKLLYWRKKLGKDARKPGPSKQTSKPKLVPVRIVPDPPPAETTSDKFEVWFANGMSLDVPPGFDGDDLRRLVGVLHSC